jgi:hypothetical protein
MLRTHGEAPWVTPILPIGTSVRPGERAAVTTTSRLLPDGLITSKPHRVEGTIVAVAAGHLVLAVRGWMAWAVPCAEIVSIDYLDGKEQR